VQEPGFHRRQRSRTRLPSPTECKNQASSAEVKKVCRPSVLFPLGAIGRKSEWGPKTIQPCTSDGHRGIQQQHLVIELAMPPATVGARWPGRIPRVTATMVSSSTW
jgi:hypothetical protein